MKERGTKKRLEGMVLSARMDKTVIVMVERVIKHKVYKKYIKRRKKFVAHDENNRCGVGDRVEIIESRPLSRTKRWRVTNIVQKAV